MARKGLSLIWNVMDSEGLATADPISARRGMMTTPQIQSFFRKLSLAILLSGFWDLLSPLLPPSSQPWRLREGVPPGGVAP